MLLCFEGFTRLFQHRKHILLAYHGRLGMLILQCVFVHGGYVLLTLQLEGAPSLPTLLSSLVSKFRLVGIVLPDLLNYPRGKDFSKEYSKSLSILGTQKSQLHPFCSYLCSTLFIFLLFF